MFEAFEATEKFDHSSAKKTEVEVLDWNKGGLTNSQGRISALLIFQTTTNYALAVYPSRNLLPYQIRIYE